MALGGTVTKWEAGRALEQELFHCLVDADVRLLLDKAIELHGADLVDPHIKSASDGSISLYDIQTLSLIGGISVQQRDALGMAAKSKAAWFKSVSAMEAAAFAVIGPGLAAATPDFRQKVNDIFTWAENV
ncbi:MAG: hypothetical protein ACKVOJ_05105 [Sphingomonadaceae bacterium]